MGRKTISELEDELAMERDDNARLYVKVENLRAEVAEIEASDDSDEPGTSANRAAGWLGQTREPRSLEIVEPTDGQPPGGCWTNERPV